MKIAFSTLACPKWTLEEIISAACQYGYDGVELRGYRSEMNLPGMPEFTTDLSKTIAKFDKAGIQVSALGSGVKLLNPPGKDEAAVAEVAAYAQLGRDMGVSTIRIFGGAFEGRSRDQGLQAGVENLARMAELAGSVTIALETHDDWSDSSLVGEAVSRVGAPNVKALWDLHHPFRQKGESPATTHANMGAFTSYVHIKDSYVGPDGKPAYVLPGEGDVPLAEMIGLLAKSGYDGYLSAEWEQYWHPHLAGPEISLPAHAAFLKKFA